MALLPGVDRPCYVSLDEDIDTVYDVIDAMMWDARLGSISVVLDSVDVETIDVALMLAYLTITVPCRCLSARTSYYDRVKAYLELTLEGDRVKALLRGLQ